MRRPKITTAIVHDWLTNMGGAEPQVLLMHKMFPDAPVYTSVYDRTRMKPFEDIDVRTTYLQRLLPRPLRYKHILWPVLRAHAFRRLDLRSYDLILSSSTAESKSVIKRPNALHICYCNTPTRYYWSHYEEFRREFRFGILTPLIRPFIPGFVRWMRRLDLEAASRVDVFIANSTVVSERIAKYYSRESTVVFPGVDTQRFGKAPDPKPAKKHGYIMWGRHVPYKRFDLAIMACNELAIDLTIVGTGPETDALKSLAGPTVRFVGRVSDEELVRLAYSAEGFLFAGEEDFGIAPVEAMAAGLPVLAYRGGGALDYVIPGKTGAFFDDMTVKSLVTALRSFRPSTYRHDNLTSTANRFSIEEFNKNFAKVVDNALVAHYKS